VKIYPESASDKGQLDAYIEKLSEQRSIAIEEGEYRAEDIYMALAYLVPDNAKDAYAFADASTKICKDAGIDGILVMNWHTGNAAEGYKPKAAPLCKTSMSMILGELLDAYQRGDISPVDANAVDLARSLRNAALHRFDFSMPNPSGIRGRFPDNDAFEASLNDYQHGVLDCFRSAVSLAGCKRPLVASPLHTSIGIPARESPAGKANNTLCRIMTASYDSAEPAGAFIIQIAKPVYEQSLELIRRNLSSLVIPYVLQEAGPDGKPLYHENGKQDQPVYRIFFPDDGEELASDMKNSLQAQFANLLEKMKKVFQSW
jgi:hypothetical protein